MVIIQLKEMKFIERKDKEKEEKKS